MWTVQKDTSFRLQMNVNHILDIDIQIIEAFINYAKNSDDKKIVCNAYVKMLFDTYIQGKREITIRLDALNNCFGQKMTKIIMHSEMERMKVKKGYYYRNLVSSTRNLLSQNVFSIFPRLTVINILRQHVIMMRTIVIHLIYCNFWILL